MYFVYSFLCILYTTKSVFRMAAICKKKIVEILMSKSILGIHYTRLDFTGKL
jgi:hypothetical protein